MTTLYDFWMKRLLILLLYMSLSGCAGMNYVLENYSDSTFVEHEMSEDTYRIFDKPAESRLMITPSLGTAAGQGTQQAFVGRQYVGQPKPVFSKAVASYLKSTGRDCEIVDGYIILSPQWEFTYQCKPT